MANAKILNKLELPHILVEAVKEHRAVIVFGAGASMECTNAQGDAPPSGDRLRDHLARKFFGTEGESRDLATIAEMAIANGAGQSIVFEEISKLLTGYEPSVAHQKLPNFRWRGFATTNYDTLIEQGYAKNNARKQTCLPFVKDTEPYDDRLRGELHPLALLKLHGCIAHRLDSDIPLVLSNEHYHRYQTNRIHLYNRLCQWAQASPLIFIGYRLADPHLRSLIYDIQSDRRPQWYIVSPGGDEYDRRFWASKNVQVLSGTFSEFVDALDSQVPELSRVLSISNDVSDTPYRKHFRTNNFGSDLMRDSFNKDLEYIYSGVSFEEVAPNKFYSGHDQGWCCIVRKYDFPRRVGEKLLYTALDENDRRQVKFFLLQGSAGAGKTIALRRAAYDAATALEQLVVWLKPSGQPRAEVFDELYGLTGKRILLFVDQISRHSNNFATFLGRLQDRGAPITIIASEREADWGSYCKTLEDAFTPEIYTLKKLSAREVEDLVDLLERHNSLGHLHAKQKNDRIAAFLDEDRADRQLLVALHELTQGKPFETIIREEYDRITPDGARQLYLDIATMHQFGVIARAGAISRVSGIRFEDFENNFFAPLRDIVRVTQDPYTGDKGYQTRHSKVSSILFGVACLDDESKARQLSRILSGLDAGFSSDKRIIEGVCKGRKLSQEFSRVEPARQVFEAAMVELPNSAFLRQQAAILEYLHSGGSLDRAQELAQAARKLDANNHIYIHTLAEVARRQANNVTSKIQSERYRAQARAYLNEISLKDSRKDLTFCRLLIDEAIELLKALPDEAKDHETLEFDDKVDEAITRLRRAQQDFPNEAEFPSAEGQLWRQLGESDKASKAFSSAISLRPRSTGAFSHLSRIQMASGSHADAIQTLDKALEQFPSDKNVHLQMALLILDIDTAKAEFHFRSSFGPGDHNFEARFLFAEFLFWMGKVDESKKLFEEIDAKAPQNFRRQEPASDDVITSRLGECAGMIESIKERFFFIRFGGYPASIFAHMSSLYHFTFDELQVGARVMFKIRFNRRGPVAVITRMP